MLCPSIVLYAVGYSVAAGGSDAGLVKTGLISFATSPPGASITIDGRRRAEKTPAVVRDLLPGKYAVVLDLPGRRPWSATLDVEAEKATAAERVILPEKRPAVETLVPVPFASLGGPAGLDFFLLWKGDRLTEQFVFQWKTSVLRPLVEEGSEYADLKVKARYFRDGSRHFLVRAGGPGGDRWLWIRVDGDKTQVKNLTSLFLVEPERVAWQAGHEDAVYAIRAGRVDRILTAEPAVTPEFLKDVRGFGLAGRRILFLDSSYAFLARDRDGDGESGTLDVPRLRAEMKDGVFYEIFPLEGGESAFRGDDGSLLLERFPYALARGGVDGLSLAPGAVFTREGGSAGRADLERPAPSLDRFYAGSRVEQLWWVNGGAHALVRDGDRIVLAEAHYFGRPWTHEIARTKRGADAYYAESGDAYFLDLSGALRRVRVWDKPSPLGTEPS